MRIARRTAVLLLVLAPLGFVVGTNPASAKTTPALATVLSPSNHAGAPSTDTAKLTGGSSHPTGTVTFQFYAGTGCTGTAINTETASLTTTSSTAGNAVATFFEPDAIGSTTSITATYNGDLENSSVTAICEDATTATPAVPSISTMATSSPLGSPVTDTVTLSGLSGTNARGGVVWMARYGSCGGAAAFTTTVDLAAGFIAVSPVTGLFTGTLSAQFTPTSGTGPYVWSVTYVGDSNNNPAVEACGASPLTETSYSDPVITTSSLPGANHGWAYSATISALGGTLPLHWSKSCVAAGQKCPPGLGITSAGATSQHAVISGTAGATGSYAFTVTVTDSTSPTPQSVSKTFTITIS